MKTFIQKILTLISSLSLILSSLPISGYSSDSVQVEEILSSINSFSVQIYGNKEKKQTGILQQIQDAYKNIDLDDENDIELSDFNYNHILSKINKLHRLIDNALEDNSLSEDMRANIMLTAFAYIDLPFYEFLSVWKSNDRLGDRYQLLNKFRSKFSMDYLTENLREQAEHAGFQILENSNDTFSFELSAYAQLEKELQVSAQIPSVHNYLKSARLMALQMMLQQQSLYQSYLGKSNKVDIPQSCQNVSFTKLPESTTFEMPSEEVRNKMINNMLVNNGLVAGTDTYREYFLENSNPELATGSVTKLLAFDRYQIANMALNSKKHVTIDDISSFGQVLTIKQNEIMSHFSRAKKRSKARACGGRNCHDRMSKRSISKVEKYVDQMLQFSNPDWIIEKNGDKITVDTESYNEYIINILKKKNKRSWKEIIPSSLMHKWKQRDVKINFLSTGAHPMWQSWKLQKIKRGLESLTQKKRKSVINMVCRTSRAKLCTRISRYVYDANSTLNKVQNALSEFGSDNTYLPEILKNQTLYDQNSNFFHSLWEALLRQKVTSRTLNQFNIISNQMNSYNQWAAVYISYQHILATATLTHSERALLEKFGTSLGLTEEFTPFMANKLLNKKEKEALWHQVLTQANEKNGHLFNQDSPLQDEKTSYYDIVTRLAQKNIFSEEAIMDSIRSFDKQADITPMYSQIKGIEKSNDFKKIELLQELYQSKGNIEKQEQIAEILIQLDNETSHDNEENEWGDFAQMSSNDIKLLYLEMDNKIKAPMYKYIIQDAATLRLRQIKRKIKYLCELDDGHIDDIKDIYYTTAKAQMEINSQFGIEATKNVRDYLGKYNRNEKESLWFGLGSAALFIGSTVLGAGCTVVTGGMCMPLAAAVLAGLAAGSQVYVANVEFSESYDANMRAKEIAEFEELGLTSTENVSAVKRSYLWGVMEIAFTVPLIGHLGRGIQVGNKMIKASLKGTLKGATKLEKKLFYKKITEEVNTKYAGHILGFNSLSQEIKSSLGSLFKKQATNPLITKAFSAGKTVVTQTPKEIDDAFAQSVMKFFSNSPKKFSNFIANFSDKEVQSSKKILKKLAIYETPENLSKLRRIWGKGLPRMKIKRLEKFLEQEKSIKNLSAKIALLDESPEAFAKFISENADTFAVIFESLPFQKKEIFHMAVALGGPVIRSRVPLYSRLTEVTIMKRIASARDILRKQSLREISQKTLGLSSGVAYHQTYELYNGFQESVLKSASISNIGQIKRLEAFNKKIFINVMAALQKKGFNGNQTELRRILFSPSNIEESVQAAKIWNSIPSDELFKFSNEEKFLKYMVKELQNYKGINQFQDFVHALKLLSISKTPELANIL